MRQTISNLFLVLTKRDKLQYLVIVFLSVIQLTFELTGLGVIFPFVKLISNPDSILTHPIGLKIMSYLPITQKGSLIAFIGLGIVVLFVFKTLFSLFFFYCSQRFASTRQILIANRLLKKYLNLDYQSFLKRNSSILTKNLIIECARMINLLSALTVLVSELLVGSGITIFLFYMAPRTTFIVIIFFGIFIFFFFNLTKAKLSRYSSEVSLFSGLYTKYIQEGIGSFKELKINQKENYFLDCSFSASHSFAKRNYLFATFQSVPRLLLEALGVIGLLILITLKSLTKQDIQAIIPEISLLGMAFYRLLPSINRIISSVNQIKFSQKSAEIVADELKKQQKVHEPLTQQNTLNLEEHITLSNISYFYPESTQPALKNISIRFSKGGIYGITGSSGSGKTTLVDTLLLLLTPSTGHLQLDDQIITDEYKTEFYKKVAYVPQQIFLLDDTILSNIAFGLIEEQIDLEKVNYALEGASLSELINELEHGLYTVIGDRGIRLSGGQRQRIGLARALYRKPQILILDEATSALDNITEKEIIKNIEILNKSKMMTIIMIAHRLSTLVNADIIFVLSNGEVVGSDNHEGLLKNCAIYKRLNEISYQK